MADLTPHPLVISVALELGRPDPNSSGPPSSFGEAAANVEKATKNRLAGAQDELARAFADQANVPAVSLFAGYLGGPVEHDGQDWRLLYLDALLADWMLIQVADIVAHERLATENAPAGVIDMLWVKATANLVTGPAHAPTPGAFSSASSRAGDLRPRPRVGPSRQRAGSSARRRRPAAAGSRAPPATDLSRRRSGTGPSRSR